ncbi:MAG: hypothetical protein AVDCRST_MAG22-943 [uncultured Rubrobacteraceae bacterium]|uniref:DUF998 domain-containing protein n=1 Tax=uncultured Rubrobacteraceae bacterium TaxID=349277 RepID=A0A6J4NS91_9ACTN|nr:MAG: hypothetical protein AVDCRST_MAG22-943 [uncultured Rubrobacteraceae bacterium]
MKVLRRLLGFLVRWAGLLVVPGGVLWTLSPIGASISETAFGTPNVFWKLFPSAPLLILVGLVGLQARQWGRSGLLQKIGFALALLGLVLIIAGGTGLFWLGLDDTFIMTAPAYRAFRLGLLLLGAGSILFGVAAPRDGALPTWGLLPFVVASLCGLISFATDLGSFGTVLWMLFGLGWAWLGLSLAVDGFLSWWAGRSARGAAAEG